METINLQDLRIGQKVRIKTGIKGEKRSIPMTVVGIFSSLSRPGHATLYLDFEGNSGDVWEEDIEDVELIMGGENL